jgi:hypothetical protein
VIKTSTPLGKSVSIQQDFYAKIVASNLTALMEIAAQKKVDKRTHDLAKLGLNLLGNLTLNHEFFYPLFFVRLFPSKRLNLRQSLRIIFIFQPIKALCN